VVLEEEVAWEEVKVLLVGVVEGVAMWTGVSTRSKKTLWIRIWRILVLVQVKGGRGDGGG
jgi:hypothetical protein